MSAQEVVWMALGNLVPSLPVLLVWAGGLLAAPTRLRRHRRSSALLAGEQEEAAPAGQTPSRPHPSRPGQFSNICAIRNG